jgi:DNA-binding response OmpR family regulator
MTNHIFLIHWNLREAEEHADVLRRSGFEVSIEAQDGAMAWRNIKSNPPKVVLIYLSRLPSHGRQTAQGIKLTKATREIPVVFVDGKDDVVEKTKEMIPEAIFTTSSDLLETLKNSI